MGERKKAFYCYFSWQSSFDLLTDAEAGQLIKALIPYARDGALPGFADARSGDGRILAMAFAPIRCDIDRAAAEYDKVCEQNARNSAQRKSKTKTTDIDRYRPMSTGDDKEEGEEEADNKEKGAEEEDSDPPAAPPVIAFPLRGEELCIYEGEFREWQDRYPRLDVLGSLKKMRAWLLKNSNRYSTEAELKSFISRWLQKDAEERKVQRKKTARDFGERTYNMEALEEQLLKANKN